MKAWRIYEKGIIKLDEMESQPVGAKCVKLKMLSASISLSDLMLYEGKLTLKCSPLILGRLGVGMVTEVGEEVTGFVRGNRVVINPYDCCHSCVNCKSNKYELCEKLLTLGVDDNGVLSDFCVVGADELFILPDRVKDGEAVYLEHVAMAINAISKLSIQKGDHIAIVGASILGIIMAQVAIYYQAVPILVDTRQDRLDLAESLGVYYTVNSVEIDPQKKIFSITGGRMADAVSFITTSKMSLLRSLEYACKGGRVAILGWADTKTDLTACLSSVFNKSLTVTGVNNGAKNLLSAINMLANKSVDVSRFTSREIPLAEVGKYLEEMALLPNKYMKVVVKI